VEAARQYNVHEAETPSSRILEQVVALRPEVRRSGRGSIRGQIHVPDDFDTLPDDIADAFGMC
jgi:hypothetical protein